MKNTLGLAALDEHHAALLWHIFYRQSSLAGSTAQQRNAPLAQVHPVLVFAQHNVLSFLMHTPSAQDELPVLRHCVLTVPGGIRRAG